MPVSLEEVVDLVQLGPHPFLNRDAPQPELSAPALPADVRETKEAERLRLPALVIGVTPKKVQLHGSG
jgi:hypothetical protein